MSYRYRSLIFHERWRPVERWGYSLGILALAMASRRLLFPVDWPYVFMPFALAVPIVYFFFGRWPGIVVLAASGASALLLSDQHNELSLRTASGLLLYFVHGAIICWLIDQLQGATLSFRAEKRDREALLDTQTDWVTRVDAEGCFTYLNPAAAAAFGVPLPEGLGQCFRDVLRQEDLPEILAKLSTLSPANPVVIGENRLGAASDRLIWGQFINRGIFDDQGRLTGIQTVGRDITERKRLEQRLTDLAKEFEDLYQHAPCAYYSLDGEGRFLHANDKLGEWLGVRTADLIAGRRISEFLRDDDQARFERDFAAFKQRGQVHGLEIELRSQDGGTRTVVIDAVGAYDEGGRFLHSRTVLTDVSERKRAEAEAQRQNEELERRVGERTASLQHTTNELETFTYSLSHDLRAPIRSINTTASILGEEHGTNLPPGVLAGLDKIRATSHRMSQLMDALLDLSAMGRLVEPEHRFSQADLVATAIDTLLAEDSPRRAQIQVGDMPEGFGQPRLVQQVWVNLLSNALKFTTGMVEEPRIDVGFDRDAGAWFVRDNGAGFDERYANRIFRPFERGHDRTHFTGNGIGLAIAERVVRRHGGRIGCSSAPGKGAVFHFTLAGAGGDGR